MRRWRRSSGGDDDVDDDVDISDNSSTTSSGEESMEDSDVGEPNPTDDGGQRLTAGELDKLLQLQDMTGIDSIEVCQHLLESKGWDLEAAAREFLGDATTTSPLSAGGASAAPTTRPPRTPPSNFSRPSGAAVASRDGRVRSEASYGILGWSWYLLTLPIRVPVAVVGGTFSIVYQVLAFVLGSSGDGHPRRVESPPNNRRPAAAEVADFKNAFELQYGRVHPTFYEGTYSQVLDDAKRQLRFLVAYIHSPGHENTALFCARTLTSPDVAEFMAERQVLFWGCSVETAEGQKVSRIFHETSYPFLAVIVLRQNRMLIVGRLDDARVMHDPAAFLTYLTGVIADNEAFIIAARADREERDRNQAIRREQDEAFQETLRQDQEKERKKREAEEAKKKAEEEANARIRAEEERRERIRAAKLDWVDRIPEEPAEGSPDAIRVLVKLPEGQRLERRFDRRSSLKGLFFYIFCHPDSPANFDVTTNFPRKVLPCKPKQLLAELFRLGDDQQHHLQIEAASNDGADEEPPTFAEVGISGSTMLFVNDLEA